MQEFKQNLSVPQFCDHQGCFQSSETRTKSVLTLELTAADEFTREAAIKVTSSILQHKRRWRNKVCELSESTEWHVWHLDTSEELSFEPGECFWTEESEIRAQSLLDLGTAVGSAWRQGHWWWACAECVACVVLRRTPSHVPVFVRHSVPSAGEVESPPSETLQEILLGSPTLNLHMADSVAWVDGAAPEVMKPALFVPVHILKSSSQSHPDHPDDKNRIW